MFFFYTNALLFTPEFIGRIELLDGIAQLAGEARYPNTHNQGFP